MRRTFKLFLQRAAALIAMTTALAGAGAFLIPTTASAGVSGCWNGLDSGTNNWAWGSCSGVTGNTHWRLHVSCTWGNTVYSNWIYGSARTDVRCPTGDTYRASQIDIIY